VGNAVLCGVAATMAEHAPWRCRRRPLHHRQYRLATAPSAAQGPGGGRRRRRRRPDGRHLGRGRRRTGGAWLRLRCRGTARGGRHAARGRQWRGGCAWGGRMYGLRAGGKVVVAPLAGETVGWAADVPCVVFGYVQRAAGEGREEGFTSASTQGDGRYVWHAGHRLHRARVAAVSGRAHRGATSVSWKVRVWVERAGGCGGGGGGVVCARHVIGAQFVAVARRHEDVLGREAPRDHVGRCRGALRLRHIGGCHLGESGSTPLSSEDCLDRAAGRHRLGKHGRRRYTEYSRALCSGGAYLPARWCRNGITSP